MRKTKIVATIGPKTANYDNLLKLTKLGMNVARLNMSHGDHDWHSKVIRSIRTINEKGTHSVAILLDTKGPEVRSGDIKLPLFLRAGERMTFTIRREPEYESNCVDVSYDGFIEDIHLGDVLLVDGGMLSFRVLEKNQTDVICETLDGGELTSRRHLNVRGKSAQLPSITEKDWNDIKFGIEQGIDFIAPSFVKDANVVRELKSFLQKGNHAINVIAKIESAAAIPHLHEILEASDGAMVARGDLGSELPLEEVPLIQEEMVSYCRKLGKPVIVATHLLESMIIHPTPTRAEITDIAQAVRSKADATMLSGETASGNFPFRAVEVMDAVARRIERKLEEDLKIDMETTPDNSNDEIVRSASIMANNLKSGAILVFTRRGYMASLLAKARPNAPIYAFTNTSHVRRQLNLYWGVMPFRIQFSRDPEKTIQRAIEHLKERNLLTPNQEVIIVSDILVSDELVKTIQIREIK